MLHAVQRFPGSITALMSMVQHPACCPASQCCICMLSCLCREEVRGAKVESLSLDLADLQSVRDMANRCLDMGHPLDVLINNAVRVK